MITLRDDQEDFIDRLRRSFVSHKSVLGMAPTGFGKCLGRDTPVLMYDGSVRPVQDVKPGDLIMGPDSRSRQVLTCARGIGPLYRVTPIKGDPYIVNDEHILSLKITRGAKLAAYPDGSICNITVKEYLAKSKSFRHVAKGWRCKIDFEKNWHQPVDAYFLGVWLGDGTSKMSSVTTGDQEIMDACSHEFERFGLTMRVEPNSENSVIVHGVSLTSRGNPLMKALDRLGVLNNKHIPHIYKTASREKRLQILAGVIDTDGCLAGSSCYDLTLKSERLFDDVLFIVRSLGLSASKQAVTKICGNNGKTGQYYRMTISGDVNEIPVRLPRKAAQPRRQKKDVLLTGITVEPIGEGEYFGFEISGDRLFVLGDFTVTHNTVAAAYIVQSSMAKGKRVLFTVHRKELLDQTAITFDAFGIPYGFIKSGIVYDSKQLVHIASIDTLRNRLDVVTPPDLMVIDEAHLARANTWHECASRFRLQGSRLLGLSGSPQRLDGRGLGELFTDLVLGPSMGDLIAAGHLSTYRYIAPTRVDTSAIKKSMGDFAKAELGQLMLASKLGGDIVSNWRKHAQGKRTICFSVSHAHSDQLIEDFRSAGITAESISSKTPAGERRRLINDFADGKISILCNVELITTGFDLAAQVGRDVTVEAVIMARPTQSLALYLQMVGRALRRKPEPAIILDHASNYERHGLPDDEREWSLEGKAKGKTKQPPPPPTCEACFCLMPVGSTICPSCKTPVSPDRVQSRQVDIDTSVELVEVNDVSKQEAKRQRVLEEKNCKTYEDFVELGKRRGYKDGWADHRWAARQGRGSSHPWRNRDW